MFNALLKVQWKWTRFAVLIATVAGFAAPVASVRMLMFQQSYWRGTAADVVNTMQSMSILYALLAGALGLAVAFLAWSADQKGRHMYALSLPISRAQYALMRFGAGSLFLLIPAVGVLIGCFVAVGVADIPTGMHAYPVSLTFRFLLSAFVAFAIFFAVAAASQRAAAIMLGSVAGFIFISVVISAMGVRTNLLEKALTFVFAEPGLLSIFTGRWMLIDV